MKERERERGERRECSRVLPRPFERRLCLCRRHSGRRHSLGLWCARLDGALGFGRARARLRRGLARAL